MTRLSEHFTLAEFTRSQTATRHDIDNTPDAGVIDNLRLVAAELEIVRWWLSREAGYTVPIIITSGYRCEKLNTMIGGSKTSAHMHGLAADFVTTTFPPPALVKMIRNRISFDQLIEEFGEWTHLGLSLRKYRNEVKHFKR